MFRNNDLAGSIRKDCRHWIYRVLLGRKKGREQYVQQRNMFWLSILDMEVLL